MNIYERSLADVHVLLKKWDVSDVDPNSVDGWSCVTCGELVHGVIDRPERTPCCDACAQAIVEKFRTAPLGVVLTDKERATIKKFVMHTLRYQVPDTIRQIVPILERLEDEHD